MFLHVYCCVDIYLCLGDCCYYVRNYQLVTLRFLKRYPVSQIPLFKNIRNISNGGINNTANVTNK